MSNFLQKARFLALLGVISLSFGVCGSIWLGRSQDFQHNNTNYYELRERLYIAVSLIELVDSFLIAIALQIFSLSMYELFVGKLNLLDWMLAHNLHELKTKVKQFDCFSYGSQVFGAFSRVEEPKKFPILCNCSISGCSHLDSI